MNKTNKVYTVKLKNKTLSRLFKNTYTKLRPEDFWNVEGLTKRESKKMTNLSDLLFEKQKGNDYLAIKRKGRISIIRI